MRLVRFGLVGALNTLVDLALYVVLAGFLPLLVANFVSTSCGMAVSFCLHRGFTFRFAGSPWLFVLVTASGLWLVQPLVLVLSPFGVVVSKLVALGVGVVWNYLLYHFVVFRSSEQLRA